MIPTYSTGAIALTSRAAFTVRAEADVRPILSASVFTLSFSDTHKLSSSFKFKRVNVDEFPALGTQLIQVGFNRSAFSSFENALGRDVL